MVGFNSNGSNIAISSRVASPGGIPLRTIAVYTIAVYYPEEAIHEKYNPERRREPD